jgi:hypothetical protein
MRDIMQNFNIESNKRHFIDLVTDKINPHRPNAQKLLDWLDKTDFYTAPASTKYHLCIEGGLCQHSLNVYDTLVKLCDVFLDNDVRSDAIAVCGLFHDFCKIDMYKPDTKMVKDYNGDPDLIVEPPSYSGWTKIRCYNYKESNFEFGHGEKSVYLVNQFIRLSKVEAMAIRWHMGAYEEADKYAITKGLQAHPRVTLTHMADLMATNITENDNTSTNAK